MKLVLNSISRDTLSSMFSKVRFSPSLSTNTLITSDIEANFSLLDTLIAIRALKANKIK